GSRGQRELCRHGRRRDLRHRASSPARVRRPDQGQALRVVELERHGSVRHVARVRSGRERGHVLLRGRAQGAGVAGLAARVAEKAGHQALHRMAAVAPSRRSAEADAGRDRRSRPGDLAGKRVPPAGLPPRLDPAREAPRKTRGLRATTRVGLVPARRPARPAARELRRRAHGIQWRGARILPTPARAAMNRTQPMITGAQAIVDCLKREGVDHVFGIPGTMNLPVLDALRATPEIRFVLTRHEQGAAFMAYGYARSLHRPAIVTATEGPGVTNLVTGIGAAYKGYVPVISISGAQDLFVREKDASQDIDQVTLHRSITKWAYSIPSVGKIQEAVRRASRVALAEPLGPVHLDVSRDILLQHTELETIAPEAYRPSSRPRCAEGELDRAADLIARAQRPILLAGGGA